MTRATIKSGLLAWRNAASLRAWFCFALCSLGSGCAAITNPVGDSVPVRLLPPDLFGPSKAASATIPLNMLRQPMPPVYQLDHGDVLGIYIEGIVGDKNQPPPIHVAP